MRSPVQDEFPAPAAGLWAAPGTPLPDQVAVGAGQALFVDGRCLRDGRPPQHLELLAGDRVVPLMGWGTPPPRSRSGEEYWWTVLELEPVSEPTGLELRLRAADRGREDLIASVGTLRLLPALPAPEEAVGIRPGPDEPDDGRPLVAVCMATFDPAPELFRRQLDSIRAQTHERWICLISDDGSSEHAWREIEAAVDGDPRFVLSRAPANRGFYENFERALSMAPREADYVALCDQDDEWRPDKLEALIAGLAPGARLVYSDMRIVEERGGVLSKTYWSFRRNNHTAFGSMLLANTVTGAASLFRRELLDDVLPFPPRHAAAYHDHWIAQVAMALGPISYVDRPLYDYVQHGAAAIGYLQANGEGRFSGSLVRRSQITWERFRRRRYRLGWRQPYFNIYCRLTIAATVLRARCAERMEPGKRRVVETLLDPRRAAPWLLRRVVRDGLANTETLGRERVILAGLAWRGAREGRRRARARV